MKSGAVSDVKPENWRHIKTGRIYTRLVAPAEVQINGEWFPAVVYHSAGYFYTRTVADFSAKFERAT